MAVMETLDADDRSNVIWVDVLRDREFQGYAARQPIIASWACGPDPGSPGTETRHPACCRGVPEETREHRTVNPRPAGPS
ncbi:hypothetical protein GCM10009665_79430 [Kitasatospora nipponensis]|uniref:Uncharacterized protein n=1 Tax=Kitasatospora nipponensis TaxID=258049 RepID=A0ABN1TEI8_9ACTN